MKIFQSRQCNSVGALQGPVKAGSPLPLHFAGVLMSNDGFEQLSAIAGLSREKEGISLTRAMIYSLRALSPGIQVSIMEVFGHRKMEMPGDKAVSENMNIRRFDDTGHRLEQRESVTDLADVIQRLQPAAFDSETRGVGRVIVPLTGDIGPLRLVVLDEIPIDPWVRANIMQVVEIYGNLIGLMDSRERDALTGLLNRQTFATLFELASQRMVAGEASALALAVLDIDQFKRVNDSFGHLFGDEVLIHFARLMERTFRYTDDLFRFGGEEFLVLLPTPEPDGAGVALERFRRVIESYDFPGVGAVTVSIGYVICDRGALPTTLADRADQALYAAKDRGRNQVVDYADVVACHTKIGAIDLF